MRIREELLGLLDAAEDRDARLRALDTAAARLADPSKGRLLAWVLARDPFPAEDDQGLARIAEQLVIDDPDELASQCSSWSSRCSESLSSVGRYDGGWGCRTRTRRVSGGGSSGCLLERSMKEPGQSG